MLRGERSSQFRPTEDDAVLKETPSGVFDKTPARAKTVVHRVPVLFLDFTGVLSDDEPIMRQIWKQICIDNGNIVKDGDNYWYKGLDAYQSVSGVAELPPEHRRAPLIDWDDVWTNPRRNWYGIGNEAVYEELCKAGRLPNTDSYEDVRTIIDSFYLNAIANQALRLRHGMNEILAYAEENNIPVVIVSNDSRPLCLLKLKALGLLGDGGRLAGPLKLLVTPEDVDGKLKPAPALYLEAVKQILECLGVTHIQAHLIEDSPAGVLSGHRASKILQKSGHQLSIAHYPFDLESVLAKGANIKVQGANVVSTTINILSQMIRVYMHSYGEPRAVKS